MRRNEKKHKEKIRPPDSILGRPLLHFGAALTLFWGGPNSISGRPWLHIGAAMTPFQGGFSNIVRGPFFLLTFLLISPHPPICERGELYHLNERKNLLYICQYVKLVNYPIKTKCSSCRRHCKTWNKTPGVTICLPHLYLARWGLRPIKLHLV